MQGTVAEVLQRFEAYAQDENALDTDVLTLYLHVDPGYQENQASQPAWEVWLKNAIKEIEAGLDLAEKKQWKHLRSNSEDPRKNWPKIKARLEAYIADYKPTGRSLMLVIGPNTTLGYDLPVALDNNFYYGMAHLSDFLWAIDEYKQYIVLLFSQDQVRATTVFLGKAVTQAEVHIDQTWHRKERKSAHNAQIQQRQDELDRRFARYIADEINKYYLDNSDVERIILGGNSRIAHATRQLLHPHVAEDVLGVIPLPFDAKDHEIGTTTMEIAAAHEAEDDLALVRELINRSEVSGRAVLGVDKVSEALDRQAVRTLVMSYPLDAETFDDLIIRAVKNGCAYEFVYGEAAEQLNQNEGVGAQLFYALG
jgi:hypothetical protein